MDQAIKPEAKIKKNGNRKRSPRGTGRLFKKIGAKQYPADSPAAGPYYLTHTVDGQRITVALRDAKNKPITDRAKAEAERKRRDLEALRAKQRASLKHERGCILDMIGDADLKLTISPEDNANLRKLLKGAADELDYSKYVGSSKGGITDDHIPFKKRGIPAIDLIDFKYGPKNRYWHTDEDTMDKISADSLKIVGELTVRLLQKISWQP